MYSSSTINYFPKKGENFNKLVILFPPTCLGRTQTIETWRKLFWEKQTKTKENERKRTKTKQNELNIIVRTFKTVPVCVRIISVLGDEKSNIDLLDIEYWMLTMK